MQLLTKLLRATNTRKIFFLNHIFANYFSTALESFHRHPLPLPPKKNSTPGGKKMKTSKPSTNCSFKEQE